MLIRDSNSSSSWLISIRLVSAIAACDASDSASRWSECEKAPISPGRAPSALISCSTPMISFSWFFIGTVRNDFER